MTSTILATTTADGGSDTAFGMVDAVATPLCFIGVTILVVVLLSVSIKVALTGTRPREVFAQLGTFGFAVVMLGMAAIAPGLLTSIGDSIVGAPDDAAPTPPLEPTAPPAPAPAAAGPSSTHPADLWWLLYVGYGILGVVGLGVAIQLVRRRLRSRAATRTVQQEVRAAQLERWKIGTTAFLRVSLALTEFETDPSSIFVRPLLGDVDEPDTAKFYEAYTKARNRYLENVPHNEQLISEFVDAAVAAEQAFERADTTARTKAAAGISHNNRKLDEHERKNLKRAEALMRTALDPNATQDHAANLHDKIKELLDGIVTIPRALDRQLIASIEAARRPELTTGVVTDAPGDSHPTAIA